jgi:LysM repeat protein
MHRSSLIVILIFLFAHAFSQEEGVVVRKSSDKVMLEGKVYYIHYVREKETLYAISKAYNISEKIIALENPDLNAGLKTGMVLKIPADVIAVQEVTVSSSDEFQYHIISAGETIYSLSRKYGVPVEEIRKYNPEVEYSDLQINQVIKIPKKPITQSKDTISTAEYIYHQVKKGETLYSLSIYYGVEEDQIREINSQLKWGNLKTGEYIKIPKKQEIIAADTVVIMPDTISFDSLDLIRDTTRIERWIETDCMELSPDPVKRKLVVGLFLPLALRTEEIMDSITLQDAITKAEENPDIGESKWKEIKKLEEELSAINPRIIGFLDFYEGVLLALDSLKNEGISVDLYVYDTERDTMHIEQIMQQNEMRKMDMIFGPVEPDNLKIVAEFGKKHKIPVISPFTDNQILLRNNPYFIQMIPSQEIEFRNWARFLTNYVTDSIIIIHDDDSLEYEIVDFLMQEIYEELANREYYNESALKEVVINDSIEYDITQFLTSGIKNIIIIPSSNEAYVSNILTALFLQVANYDIQVFGMSNWHKFQSIDLEYLHLMGMNYYTSFYVDYTKKAVMDFIKKFRKVYNTEPYRVSPRGYNLSMYGFDLMYNFTTLFSNYRKDFTRCPVNPDYKPMLGPYLFRKAGEEGGFMNQFSIMIEYSKDFEIRQMIIDDSFYPATAKRKIFH